MSVRYGSVCSGIEAASVAWHVLGFEPAWFAEIDAAPAAVLKHRFPQVPNLGDMTMIATLIRAGLIEAPDVLVGGTPCQAFSVAGVRAGLTDPRGQLTLAYVDLLNAIDEQRPGDECVAYWENVPGVLSDKTNAFGNFLALLAGEDCELIAPGGKWPNAGCVFGPKRAIAWRVLDAQYFGVAQRRRRVFVVASARNGFDPAKLLFEFDGVRRDTAPSRETGEGTPRPFEIGPSGGRFAEVAPTLDCRAGNGPVQNQIGAGVMYAPDIARCIATREGSSQDYETTTMIAQQPAQITGTLTSAGGHAYPGQTVQDAGAGMLIPYAIQAGALRTNPNSGPDGVGVQSHIAYTIEARAEVQAVCIHADAVGRTGEAITPSADAEGRVRLRNPGMGIIGDGTTYNLMASGQPHAVAFDWKMGEKARSVALSHEHSPTLGTGADRYAVHYGAAVRRLTPRECERLQGFPDDWTLVPYRGRMMADGPRYKMCGNSMAVPCMRWLGARLLVTHPEIAFPTLRSAA